MDKNRQQAYLNLMEKLLSSPLEKELEIMIWHINLIDIGLLQAIEQVIVTLAAKGNQNAVNRLRELANKLTIALNRPLVTNPEAYRDFVFEVLDTMRQSDGEPQVIYPLLQANLDKLNDSFAQVLHILGSENFHKVTPEDAQSVAATIHDFGNLIQQFPLGNQANNIEIAIACYEVAATVYTQESFPEHWGLIQSSLGTAYLNRIKENKAENIEQAIRYYEAALEVRNCKEAPTQWATTQVNLGGAYLDRIKGDRADNLEMAIQCHQAALQVYDPINYPQVWATIQNNLGGVYLRRIRGNRSDNIETAIACFEAALPIRTREANLQEWAMTQQNLGVAYLERLKGDCTLNLEQSICYSKAALQVFKPDNFPEKWAELQINLGKAHSKKHIYDKRPEELEQAIAYYKAGLSVHNREDFSEKWARGQQSLGYAYRELGKTAKAIAHFRSALEVFTPTSFPINCFVSGYDFGETAFANKLWAEAIEGYGVALEAVETNRFWASTDVRRQEIQQEAFGAYTNIVQAYINTNQIDKAIEYVERSKARNLVELLANRNLYPKGDIPETVLNELDRLRREIDAEQRRLEIKERILNSSDGILRQQLHESMTRKIIPIDFNFHLTPRLDTRKTTFLDRTYLNQLRQQLDELIAHEISPIDPNFRLTQKVEPIPFSQIQTLTGKNTALMEWYITEDKFLTFIITPQSSTPILWQSSKEDFKALVNWADEYLKVYLIDRRQWQQNLTSRLQHLAQILHLDELLSHIPPSCDQLGLIPHRFLHLYPLHALPVSRKLATDGVTDKLTASLPSNSSATSALNIIASLLDLFPGGVKYAPSCQLLQQAQAKHRPQFNHLFAIQNPTDDLTYTDIEVQAIAQHFHPTQIMVKGDAKKSTLDNQQLRNAHCVHFSCHGYFNFEQQKSMLSALLLADCCIPTPEEPDPTSHLLLQNGTTIDLRKCLTLLDLFTLDLNQCRLVSLSACETGFTDFRYLTDEYIGLTYGFLVAGTASIVCSLWTVHDISTALLMIKFYQNLKSGSTVALALNQAQKWLRDATTSELQAWANSLNLDEDLTKPIQKKLRRRAPDEQPFHSPYHWAAFCAVGQ